MQGAVCVDRHVAWEQGSPLGEQPGSEASSSSIGVSLPVYETRGSDAAGSVGARHQMSY